MGSLRGPRERSARLEIIVTCSMIIKGKHARQKIYMPEMANSSHPHNPIHHTIHSDVVCRTSVNNPF